jgi:hypothetical protein
MSSIEVAIVRLQRVWKKHAERKRKINQLMDEIIQQYDEEDYDIGEQDDDFVPVANMPTKYDEYDANDDADYERYMWNMIRDYGLGCVVYDDEARHEDNSCAWDE